MLGMCKRKKLIVAHTTPYSSASHDKVKLKYLEDIQKILGNGVNFV